MNVHFLDLNKTAVLFFDILNGYYHLADPAAKAKKRPMVENAVRIMKAARSAALPIFFAKGNHRPDNATSVALITDTNISLKPWPGGEVTTSMHVTADDTSSAVITIFPNTAGVLFSKPIWIWLCGPTASIRSSCRAAPRTWALRQRYSPREISITT
jgi:nicotinamidase-related amidase